MDMDGMLHATDRPVNNTNWVARAANGTVQLPVPRHYVASTHLSTNFVR